MIYNYVDIDRGEAIFEFNNPVDNLSLEDLFYTYDLVEGNGLSHIDSFFTSRSNNSIKFEIIRKSSKDPWLSVLLNYLIPGVGHFYQKKWIIGLIIIFGYILIFL